MDSSLTEAEQRIQELDLTEVLKLALRDYHWDDGHSAEQAAKEYRLFLSVCWNWWKQGNHEKLAGIGRGADRIWHCHMLLPCKYSNDCERIFGDGHILDHDPFFTDSDMPEALKAAHAAYEAIGKGNEFPKDPVGACQWSIVVAKKAAIE